MTYTDRKRRQWERWYLSMSPDKTTGRFSGLDVGPPSVISIAGISDDETRVAVLVKGHQYWSGIGTRGYSSPSYYLCEGGMMAGELEYTRGEHKRARVLVDHWLKGEMTLDEIATKV